MSEPIIFFTQPENISERQKKKLEDAGVLVILVQDISHVKVIGHNWEEDFKEILYLACQAIKASNVASSDFGQSLCEKFYNEIGYYKWIKSNNGKDG